MTLAQRLYEAGYITYMRTDSTHLSGDAIGAARSFIERQYGEAYLPEKPNFYSSREQAQEAHEAIRPSDVRVKASSLAVESDAQRLYDLIWRQFVACQMTRAEYTSTSVLVDAAGYELRLRGRILPSTVTPASRPPAGRDEDVLVPDLTAGQKAGLQGARPQAALHQTPGALQRSGAGEGARKARHRPSLHLRQ